MKIPSRILKSTIWPIHRTQTGIPDQSGPGSNANEGLLYITQISRTGASTSDAI